MRCLFLTLFFKILFRCQELPNKDAEGAEERQNQAAQAGQARRHGVGRGGRGVRGGRGGSWGGISENSRIGIGIAIVKQE